MSGAPPDGGATILGMVLGEEGGVILPPLESGFGPPCGVPPPFPGPFWLPPPLLGELPPELLDELDPEAPVGSALLPVEPLSEPVLSVESASVEPSSGGGVDVGNCTTIR